MSFDQISKLFVNGVQATDTLEDLGAILDRHIAQFVSGKNGRDDTAQETQESMDTWRDCLILGWTDASSTFQARRIAYPTKKE